MTAFIDFKANEELLQLRTEVALQKEKERQKDNNNNAQERHDKVVAKMAEERSSPDTKATQQKFADIAEEVYSFRSNDVANNQFYIKEVFKKHNAVFAPVLELFPKFDLMLAHMLVLRLGWQVNKVESKISELSVEDCRQVGRSMATFMREFQQGETAIEAWRLNYQQINILFDQVEGFDSFMLIIANNILRDNKFGMMFRVAVGAALSTIDAMTDIYVIKTYYDIKRLHVQANSMLVMICTNVAFQLLVVIAQHRRKNWKVKLREAMITILFLRPAIDAFRVSTNHEDSDATIDPLLEMICNKVGSS